MAPVTGLQRMPVVGVPHGGGPMPLLGEPGHKPLVNWLSQVAKGFPRPRAILVVSAHWEEKQPTVTSKLQPEMLYDYYGFPEEAYSIKYSAPGAPELARRVADLLKAAGLPSIQDSDRGWDHGVFVPLKLIYPEADVPVVEMSMLKSLDAEEHMRVGEALAPLREEGVLILGSGLSYHNMQGFKRGRGDASAANQPSEEFDAYMQDTLTNVAHSSEQRQQLLADWEKGPSARLCHPREEHLLPLMVTAGAALYDPAEVAFSGHLMGARISGYIWS